MFRKNSYPESVRSVRRNVEPMNLPPTTREISNISTIFTRIILLHHGNQRSQASVQNLLALQERSRASGKGPFVGQTRCLISRPTSQCLPSRPPPLPFSSPAIRISPCRRNPLRRKHASAVIRVPSRLFYRCAPSASIMGES